MPYTLTLVETKLQTLTETTGATPQWIDAAITNSVNRIGEFKRMSITLNSSQNLANTKFYINPGLFLPVGFVNNIVGTGSAYWTCTSAAVITPFATIFCSYASPSVLNALPGKIQGVRIITNSSTQFKIEIDWIETYDVGSYTDPASDDNHSRLLKDIRTNPNELDTTGSTSVYTSTTIDFRTYVYLQHAAAPGLFGSIEINPNYGYKAGFYNKGTHGVAPYHSSPQFLLEINSSPATSISSVQDTVCEFRCNSPVLPTDLLIKIIRTDKFDQTVQFQANYDMDQAFIDALTPDSFRIIGPFTGPTFVAGTTYKWGFKIDKDSVLNGEKYRMIAIVRNNAFPISYESTSFISDEYIVNADVPYNGGGLTNYGAIGDIDTEFGGNDLTSCIEERMYSKLSMTFPLDQWKNDIFTRLGLVVANDPRRYLTKIEFTVKDPPVIPPSFSNYFYDIYDYRSTIKTGATSYSAKSGIIIDASIPDALVFYAEFRVA